MKDKHNMQTKTYKHISESDFNNLVCETYGRPYSFQQQDGCRDRGVYEIIVPAEPEDFDAAEMSEVVNGEQMGVSFAAWLARDPDAPLADGAKEVWRIEMFWERNFYPHESMIVNDLHARGLLGAGEYMIVVDW